jgi:hypothetical protein
MGVDPQHKFSYSYYVVALPFDPFLYGSLVIFGLATTLHTFLRDFIRRKNDFRELSARLYQVYLPYACTYLCVRFDLNLKDNVYMSKGVSKIMSFLS